MTIQDKALIVNDDIKASFGGDTPLIDITTNQADPLVNLVTSVLAGQIKVEDALKFLKSGLYANDVEGQDLTLIAQLMGSDRQIDQPSKVPIIVMGQAGSVLPAGAILLDRQGYEWFTTSDAVIQDCYGYTNACSPVGRFDLRNGELDLRDSFNNIDKATNSASPQLGGSFETDESLRRRLTGRRPQWQNKGTEGAIIWALEQLSGVLKARVITDLPDCWNTTCLDPEFVVNKYMIAVLGGLSSEIAETIFENLCFGTDRLAGSTAEIVRCDEIRFQKMCPMIVQVRYYLNCDCAETGIDYETLISDRLNEVSLTNTAFGANDICKISKDLVKVDFKILPIPLVPDCADCEIVFDNPITGEIDDTYCSSELSSGCYVSPCDIGDYNDCLTMQPWWYGIFLPEYVTRGTGCPCPTPNDGCGCGIVATDPGSPPVANDDIVTILDSPVDLTINDIATPPATLDPTTIEFNLTGATAGVVLSGGNKTATFTDGSSLIIDPSTGLVSAPINPTVSSWLVSYTIKDSNGLESNSALISFFAVGT